MCVEEYIDKEGKLLRNSNIFAFCEGERRGYHLDDNVSTDNWFADKYSPDNSHFILQCAMLIKQMS